MSEQMITCPNCDSQFSFGDVRISEEQKMILVLHGHGFSIRSIARFAGMGPQSIKYRIEESEKGKGVPIGEKLSVLDSIETDIIDVCTDIYYNCKTIKKLDELTDRAIFITEEAQRSVLNGVIDRYNTEYQTVAKQNGVDRKTPRTVFHRIINDRLKRLGDSDE